MSGDLAQICKSGDPTVEGLREAWARLFDQHIKAHGLPESYVEYMGKMAKALDYFNQAYSGKRWQIVRARVLEAEAETMLQGEGERIEVTCARISKFMGFPVQAHTCSVTDFYSYIALISKENGG